MAKTSYQLAAERQKTSRAINLLEFNVAAARGTLPTMEQRRARLREFEKRAETQAKNINRFES